MYKSRLEQISRMIYGAGEPQLTLAVFPRREKKNTRKRDEIGHTRKLGPTDWANDSINGALQRIIRDETKGRSRRD